MAKARTVEDIRAEMANNRSSLQSSFADLRESVEPKNLIKSGVDDAKTFARAEFDSFKRQFVDEEGRVRTQRVLAIAGAVAGAVALVVTLNALSGRRELKAREKKAITAS